MRGEVPLMTTSSDTPHPHQLEPEAHPKARLRPTPALVPVDWVTRA